ncbi:F-box/LRR-repeat protein At3g58900-like [Quercus lobata]|uniref:F-box/LRR-repeat protein At3g58900-like n=1 Tax=Quercus lobata TaxID=97700 RepID=UPI0012481CE7|nr:F-box/LRR-repeat protein At3g58900-like [Quercus lobata]
MCLHCHAQCDETNSFCSMDRLSEFPDEIIIYILSFLKLKEAARTSVLSRRYRGHLWKFASSSLDFDDSLLQYLRKKSFFKTLPGIDRDRYVGWVNHVLQLHQAHTIDGFKVCFPLDEEYNKLDIDNWILFSLRKNVKRLSLDFNPIFQKVYRGYYTLPT